MRRKDYILLASALLNTKPKRNLRSKYQQWKEDVESICTVLQNDNNNFDVDRFMKAVQE